MAKLGTSRIFSVMRTNQTEWELGSARASDTTNLSMRGQSSTSRARVDGMDVARRSKAAGEKR